MFDLDDTLTESKQTISIDMAEELEALTQSHEVAIISGCTMEQMEQQVIDYLGSCHFNRMHWLPTSGAQYFHEFKPVYSYALSDTEKAMIAMRGWSIIEKNLGLPGQVYGPVMEDREAQVTFSICGQEAPISVKREWNEKFDFTRRRVASKLQEQLPDFTVRVGGKTSIDVTKKGIDKAFGVRKFMEELKLNKEDILFFGDQLQPGGNDYAVKEMGIACIEVNAGPNWLWGILNANRSRWSKPEAKQLPLPF
jgi:HAD superfamily hydrolase (TIGR01484 family)